MWRLRSTVILGTLAGVLIFGALAAYGNWWWNARIDVEGVEISTAWTVDYGEPEEAAEHYGAVINVELPEDAKATILSHAENEIVFLTENEHLNCTSDGVESVVRYLVAPLGHADGERVDVWVTTILPDGSPGEELGRNHGVLMQPIEVSVLIPGAVCSGNAVTSTAN